MKKAISALLALVLSFSMCNVFTGCGSKGIKLTLDNYEQYIKVSAGARLESDYEGPSFQVGTYKGYSYVTVKYAKHIAGSVRVEGLSTNFNYSDIKVEVEITGKYRHGNLNLKGNEFESSLCWDNFKLVATCSKVDITGKGSNNSSDKFALAAGRGVPILPSGSDAVMYYESSDFFTYTYKIVGISGTVTPV